MTPSRPPPVAPGQVLAGKYRVDRVIGEGGMGVVVAATHLQLQTVVALKFILEDRGQSVERFLREARSAVRLKSEHVARVSDVGTLENGMPYMVMEYLEGRDLHTVLAENGPLPVSDAVGYVIHACEAVAEAHALGIVHRDLKPHNLFLTMGVAGRPKVKVLDFGISKSAGMELALTKSLEIVGTPSYMSPEQLRSSKDVDARTDIWAIGAVLYELLAGRVPFVAESLAQLCTMVISETPVAPYVLRPEIPRAVGDAIMRCLQRAPQDRFADVADLVSSLAPFAPEWAPARAVMDIPRSSTSGSGRAVISSPDGGAAKTAAAWSETELANHARAGWKNPVIAVALTVVVVFVVAFNMGKAFVRRHPVSSSPAASAARTSPPSPPPSASVPAAKPQPIPSASAPAIASAPTAASSAAASSTPSAPSTSASLSVRAPSTPKKPPAAKPLAPSPPAPADEMNYR